MLILTPVNFLTTKYGISFIDDKGIVHTGFIIIKTKTSNNIALFFQNKSEGYRLLEKWTLIQNFPSIQVLDKDESVNAFQEQAITITSTRLNELLLFLKESTPFYYEQLIDITGIDHIKLDLRFEIVYQLLSITNTKRLSINVFTSEGAPLNSATNVYAAAGWYERETWDRFGVFFYNHSDLRRILTDYGFKGHPLRKDFPVTGFVEVRYNADTKSIVYEKVSLSQASRETVALI